MKPFAAFSGVCSLKLAGEVQDMSPAVMERFEDDDTSISWLQAWEDEADAREKESPGGAVCESLYYVRGTPSGTGSLESRFFKGRQTNQARHMTEQAVNDRMRIYMNGPVVEEFCARKVVDTKTVYYPSALSKRSQTAYRNIFGAKTLKGRERKFKRQRGKDQ